VVSLIRRLLLLFVAAVMAPFTDQFSQRLAFFSILFSFLLFHLHTRPYLIPHVNTIETLSLSSLTLLCGFLASEDYSASFATGSGVVDSSQPIRVAIFALALFTVCVLLLLLLYPTCKAFVFKIANYRKKRREQASGSVFKKFVLSLFHASSFSFTPL
jgi:hypothetical protein